MIPACEICDSRICPDGFTVGIYPVSEKMETVQKEKSMKKIAIYGKGGIGKSTITSSLAAACAMQGYRVMQIGCDPKADSSINLLNGKKLITVMDYLRENDEEPELEDIVVEGYAGVLCIEAGGPIPGQGCAGRGIITTFTILKELEAIEVYRPDVIFFDVLGDVVCGGFAAPIRENYADEIIIVTSGEKMALYAANNIYRAVQSFQDRGYASAKGIILNSRNVKEEERLVQEFADQAGLPVLLKVPRDENIQIYEEQNMTVLQGDQNLEISRLFLDFAKRLMEE